MSEEKAQSDLENLSLGKIIFNNAPAEVGALVLDEEDDEEQIPVLSGMSVGLTLITGQLGAGKTTLLNWILTEEHGKRIAVIMNEFSDTADIEARSVSITSPSGDQTSSILSLPNGCLCCSTRDTGFAAIQQMLETQGSFDYILLETTGLADPSPITEKFWRNEEWQSDWDSKVRLDGVVTVVDAMFGLQQIEESRRPGASNEWESQVAAADVILLNKIDGVKPSEMAKLEAAIKSINATSNIIATNRSRVDLSLILNLQAYSKDPNLASTIPEIPSIPEQSHHHHSNHSHSHSHEESIKSISTVIMEVPPLTEETYSLIHSWIQILLYSSEDLPFLNLTPPHLTATESLHETTAVPEIFRLKGILWKKEEMGPAKVGWVVQGVRTVFEVEMIDRPEGEIKDDKNVGKIAVIGRNLEGIAAAFRLYLSSKHVL